MYEEIGQKMLSSHFTSYSTICYQNNWVVRAHLWRILRGRQADPQSPELTAENFYLELFSLCNEFQYYSVWLEYRHYFIIAINKATTIFVVLALSFHH